MSCFDERCPNDGYIEIVGDGACALLEIAGDGDPVAVEVGIPGPPGPQGPPGASAPETVAVGAVIVGRHVVAVVDGLAYHASNDDPQRCRNALGVSLGAQTVIGQPVQIQSSGPLSEPSWNWAPGPVYLGQNGQLTQTPPATPGLFLKEIGIAKAPDTLFVRVMHEIQVS